MSGKLEVFYGPMKSGKTSALIKQLDGVTDCVVFKPSLDTRFSEDEIVSRDGLKLKSISIDKERPELILNHAGIASSAVAIDEAQFFDDSVVWVVKQLLKKNKSVYVSGLDLDFKGDPFGAMPTLIAMANRAERLYANCDHPECERKAVRTQRLIDGKPAKRDSPLVLVGDKEFYEARCLEHHEVID